MKKRKGKDVAASSESEDEDQDASSSDGSSDEETAVDVDFEFFDPKPDDYHGVRMLLQHYLDDFEWDVAGFVNLILDQTRVGTIVKAGGDDPIGLITVLNIGRFKERPSMQAIQKFLLERAKDTPEFSKLEALWQSNENVGLLVSQRLINVPLELCTPLHDAIFDEIAWATEDEPTEALRKSFSFNQYLILTRVYTQVHTKHSSKKKSKRHRKRRPEAGDGNDSFVFIKPEDELFLQLSSWHFTFPVRAEAMLAHQTKGFQLLGVVMAVSAKQIKVFRSKLKELLT